MFPASKNAHFVRGCRSLSSSKQRDAAGLGAKMIQEKSLHVIAV